MADYIIISRNEIPINKWKYQCRQCCNKNEVLDWDKPHSVHTVWGQFCRRSSPPPVAYSPWVHLLILQRLPQPNNRDNIFPSQWSPSLCSEGEDSVAVSSPGFPTPVRQPSPVEKWVPRLLKGPTCQRSRGISHSQPSYCSPGHNRLHGAWPFVISSVVNFCWGNKSVTHLWLWIRPFF